MAIIKRSLGNRRDIMDTKFREHYPDGLGGIRADAFREGWSEGFEECKRLDARKPKSEPTEFTKKIRAYVNHQDVWYAFEEGAMEFLLQAWDIIDRQATTIRELGFLREENNEFEEKILRLIDRLSASEREIDRLTAEKFCPKCGCKMSLWCEKDVKERMDIKNKELQEEIDRLKKEIESYKFQIGEYQKLKD